MNTQTRIGLIIPSGNRLTEPQFHRYAPGGVGVHVTRLRMAGRWHKPLAELKGAIAEAAAALSDTQPGIIAFHCTASSMEGGLSGEAALLEVIQTASGCSAVTTAQAIAEALRHLRVKKLVLISPYVKKTNEHEIDYLHEAGFEVIHDLGLGLGAGGEYTTVTPKQWIEIARQNVRAEAEAYFLSCTNTTMIEAVEELEQHLGKPVVTSNQAILWSCLRKLKVPQPIKGLGCLFA